MKGSDLVLYPYPSVDGGFAAQAIYESYKDESIGPGAIQFIPYDRQSPMAVMDLPKAQDVHLLGCEWPSEEWLRECATRFRSVILHVHRKPMSDLWESIKDTAPSNVVFHRKMDSSICGMAMHYWWTNNMMVSHKLTAMKIMIQHIDDAHREKPQLPWSKQFMAGLGVIGIDYRWDVAPVVLDSVLHALNLADVIQVGVLVLDKK